jgi:hypothetical protein
MEFTINLWSALSQSYFDHLYAVAAKTGHIAKHARRLEEVHDSDYMVSLE